MSSSSNEYDKYSMSSKDHVDPSQFDTTTILIGAAIFMVIFLIGWVVYIKYSSEDSADEAYRNGFQSGLQKLNSGPQLRFFAEPTDTLKVSGFTDAGARTKALWKSRQEPFSNSREPPYFPGASNRLIRVENREKEATRALAKINQERLRRRASHISDPTSTDPIPWGPFWQEWKNTHPLDGELKEGFASFRSSDGLPPI